MKNWTLAFACAILLWVGIAALATAWYLFDFFHGFDPRQPAGLAAAFGYTVFHFRRWVFNDS